MEPDRASDSTATLWRPIVTVAMFAVLPFITFLADNAAEATVDLGFLAYPVAAFALGAVAMTLAHKHGGKVAAERTAVVFAVVIFLLFKFILVRKGVARLGLPSDYIVPLAFWLIGLAIALILTVRLSRSTPIWSFVLLFGALLVMWSTYSYVTVAGDRLSNVEGRVPSQLAGSAKVAGPDVWFFLLDGYSRADVLEHEVGYVNDSFLESLRRKGFAVEDRATASYPRTVGSLASTLAMDYVIRPGDLKSLKSLFAVVRGHNASVRAFRSLGYRYAVATDYADFSCDENVDICVYPPDGPGIGSRDVVLDATPLSKLVRWAQDLGKGDSSRRLLAPDEAVRRVSEKAGPGPIFTYAHLIAPHPPYRFESDCSPRLIADLNEHDWIDAEKQLYARAVRCLNVQLLTAVNLILERDRDAIIVIAGDHGSGFGVPLGRSANTWTDDQIRQRYGILSALRLPPACAQSPSAPEVPVNTFRIVLSCVSGRAIPLLPRERFSMVYGAETRVEKLRNVDFGAR